MKCSCAPRLAVVGAIHRLPPSRRTRSAAIPRFQVRSPVFAHCQEAAKDEELLARLSMVTWLVSLAVVSALAVATFAIWGELITRQTHVFSHLQSTRGLVRVVTPLGGTFVSQQREEGQHGKRGQVLLLFSERGHPVTPATPSATLAKLRE